MCRKFNARPVLPPNVANLHNPSVEFEESFSEFWERLHRPSWVKEGITEKVMYLLLFTCRSVRAVHIAVLTDMSVFFQFCQALPLSTATMPRLFGVSARLFSRHYLYHEYQEILGTYNIKLNIILFFSPWFGVKCERSIQTVKACLYKVIGRRNVNYFTLLMIISYSEDSQQLPFRNRLNVCDFVLLRSLLKHRTFWIL